MSADPRHLVETFNGLGNHPNYAVIHGPIQRYAKSLSGFKARPIMADDPRSDGEIISVARKVGSETAVKPVEAT